MIKSCKERVIQMRNRRKVNFNWLFIAMLGFLFVVLSLQMNRLVFQQNELSNDLTNLEYLSSSTQRLSRMILGDSNDTRVVYYIDEQTNKYLNTDSENRLYVVDEPYFREVADEVEKSWQILSDLFKLPDVEGASYDKDSISLAADNHFDSMTDLTIVITEEKNNLTAEIEQEQLKCYYILAMISFCVINDFICTSFTLKRSKELALVASLDGATGLHNRSRCQEIFKDTTSFTEKNTSAIIVIDLNDLKMVNDNQGHYEGDLLISTFANLLKEAANIHSEKPFLGRYGGDEFVVYYQNISKEEEILGFIKEIYYLSTEFNKKEDKNFNISYALGYAIQLKENQSLSLRQLFEKADENMYENKREIKKNVVIASESPIN